MKKNVLIIMIGCLIAVPCAQAQQTTSVESKVKEFLNGYDRAPTAKDLAKAGSSAEVITALQSLANDKDPVMSERAVACLGFYATPEVKAYLNARAANTKLKSTSRGTALMAMGYAFKNAAIDDIAKHLKAKNSDLREDAVLALMPMSSLKAADLLTAHLKTEKAAHIQLTIKRVTKSIKSNNKRTQLNQKKTNNLGSRR